jgi:hypothetical protein
MPDPVSTRWAADRNLLFGILALQMDFISRDALIQAMNGWVLDKAKSLRQVLHDQGNLEEDEGGLLEAIVQKHLERHSNDSEQSLAAVSTSDALRAKLQQIGDSDLQASLARMAEGLPAGADMTATRDYASLGAPTSAGQRFHILRPHARGGLGEVFVALDEELHREVALKQIRPRQAEHPESRERFVREAQITGMLEHPGVVPVYGLGQDGDGRPFYAMRFIRGQSLKDAIEHFHGPDRTSVRGGARALVNLSSSAKI